MPPIERRLERVSDGNGDPSSESGVSKAEEKPEVRFVEGLTRFFLSKYELVRAGD